MALGFTLIDASQALPDKGFSNQFIPTMKVSQFGDGYEQRLPDGINVIKQQFSINFSTRPKAEIDEIKLFFVARIGDGASFTFTYNDHTTGGTPVEVAIQVVCDFWTETYNFDDYFSLTCEFRRVFDA